MKNGTILNLHITHLLRISLRNLKPLMHGSSKCSYVLEQTCNFELQVCLSPFERLLPPVKLFILDICGGLVYITASPMNS